MRKTIVLALLAVLAIAILVAIGGDDERDLEAHAQCMEQLAEEGAWVMW